MVNLNITVDTSHATLDSKDVNTGVSEALAKAAPIIQEDARSNHRYTSRTGNLTGATKVTSTQTAINAYIDDVKAKYGKYIHSGKGQWAPDRFLDKAVDSNLNNIDMLLADSIDKELQRGSR